MVLLTVLRDTARLPFLLLTLACLLLGLATVWRIGMPLDGALLVKVAVGALCAHISVNMLNEYADFRSGLDATTQRTPFSGGSGALPAHPQWASAVLVAGLLALGLTLSVGWEVLRLRGWAILPIGLAGVLLVLLYSPWLTRHPLLCLLAPGLGVGPLMVAGTHVALGGHNLGAALAASWVPGCLASALLLLNQFPDREADRAVGRRNLVIVFGRPWAARLVLVLHGLAAVGLLAAVVLRWLPAASLWGLAPMTLAWPMGRWLLRYGDEPDRLLPAMILNVVVVLAAPLFMAVAAMSWRLN
ncbi:MAG: prenyltransferase [Burkholderiales bacterium]|nr:prenyltransferase [Burkholderiales bacterium]